MGFFLKLFPFPEYLSIPVVGVDVSDRSIKYIEFKRHDKVLKLKNFGSKNINQEVVVKGEIKKKEELINDLKTLSLEFENKYITASLPEEKAFLKVVRLPLMEESKIRQSLEVQIEEIVPFPSAEIIFDFDVMGKTKDGKNLEIILSAFPLKIAEDYSEVFKKAGLIPVAFEVENQSIFRPLVRKEEKKAVMVIDFGKTRTSYLIGEEGMVKFGSTINVAGEHIDKLLAKSLKVNAFEAERVKKDQNVHSNNSGVLNNILPVVSVIKDEARRILEYWETHSEEQFFKNKEVHKIILCGGDSNMIGLVDYLTYELKKPVEMGNPWLNIVSLDDYVPEIEKRQSLIYVTSIGLALRAFNK